MDRPPAGPIEFTEHVGLSAADSAAWDPFLFQIVEQTPLEARASFRDLALGVYLSGRHRIRRHIGASAVEGWSDPGSINLTAAGVEGAWQASGSSRSAVVVIRSEFLTRAIEEHWGADSTKFQMVNQFLVRDPVVEAVALRLARQAEDGSPAGQLYMGQRLRIPRASSDPPLLQPIADAFAINRRSPRSQVEDRSRLHRR
jgi:hypothetical protein